MTFSALLTGSDVAERLARVRSAADVFWLMV
jgi:hypothetical protein